MEKRICIGINSWISCLYMSINSDYMLPGAMACFFKIMS